ncbi:MAG: leucyl aminopeptidase [Desulfovibrio sp.]|jgi:leucyl aminopeptidase|nr:leucyl aminopeptidase [Desulfovibrio sp.]
MEIRFQNLGHEHWKAEVMLAPACEGENLPKCCPELDKAAPWLAVAPALRDFKGKSEELALLHGHPELPVPRVLAVGLGPRERVSVDGLRKAIAHAVQHCHKKGFASILLPEPALASLPGGRERLIEECVCAALLALHRFSALKKTSADTPDPQWLALGFDGKSTPDEAHAAARRGEHAGEAVMLARTLANMPANLLSPEDMAGKARELAEEYGFRCTVLDENDLAKENMGALLAVGQGSVRPSRLVILEHAPKEHAGDNPLILVGKGVTFDSGGLSIKPASNMHQMKGDMAGAAIVLATVAALAREGAPRRVVGLMACAENMPGGRATRPGDIVKAANGDSIEILNTDAEGRLALCDALCYAQKHWTPVAIVDIATLTGACAVALGGEVAGLFSNDEALAERLRAAGGVCGENNWRLPLWQPYMEHLKSEVADIANIGPREGGAINAALFLRHFVADAIPWAHLDIAGVDWTDKNTPLCPRGTSAFGARTLLELARGGTQ